MEEGKGVLVGKYCSELGSALHAVIINSVVQDSMITGWRVIHQVGARSCLVVATGFLSVVLGSILLAY
jgi:hypothetical protein